MSLGVQNKYIFLAFKFSLCRSLPWLTHIYTNTRDHFVSVRVCAQDIRNKAKKMAVKAMSHGQTVSCREQGVVGDMKNYIQTQLTAMKTLFFSC